MVCAVEPKPGSDTVGEGIAAVQTTDVQAVVSAAPSSVIVVVLRKPFPVTESGMGLQRKMLEHLSVPAGKVSESICGNVAGGGLTVTPAPLSATLLPTVPVIVSVPVRGPVVVGVKVML